MSEDAPIRHDRPMTGIAFKVTSVTIFVAMSTLIKAAGPLPAGEVVFFRSCFAIPPILLYLALRGDLPGAFRTSRPFSHFARGFVGVCSMGFGFFALARLPLPEAIMLNYAQPLMVIIFSALILGETVRIFRWSAVAVGLLGVVIICWPKLTLFSGQGGFGGDEASGVIAALLAAGSAALAMILVRNLVLTEKTGTIVIWFSISATLLSLLSIPFGWQALEFNQAALLICAGMCGGVAQLCLTESYRYAEASVVAPFEYTSMLLGLAVGYWLFNDEPTIHMMVGGSIVVSAGIFIIWRERQLGIQRAASRKATPLQ